MKILISALVLAYLTLTLACGGPATGNASNSNKGTSNKSPSSSNDNSSSKTDASSDAKAADPNRDMSPVVEDAYAFFQLIDSSTGTPPEAYIERMATVSDLKLMKIESSTLSLQDEWYTQLDCEGSFSSYLSAKDDVERLAKGDKPAKATVKGTIKEARKGYAKLDPCVLTDIKK